MNATFHHPLPADDDRDACFFVNEAVEELPIAVNVSTVNDGAALVQPLSLKDTPLPDALFPDLNMPRKLGSECLADIKSPEKFKQIPRSYSLNLSKCQCGGFALPKGASPFTCLNLVNLIILKK